MSHLSTASEDIPRGSSPLPKVATTISVPNGDVPYGGANGSTSSESVRIFHPDDVVQRPSPVPGTATATLKSSFKSGSSSATHATSVKTEEKTLRDSTKGGIPSAAKGSATSGSLSAETKRSHHQRFPSTGLSLPSASSPSDRAVYGETRANSQTYTSTSSRGVLTSSSSGNYMATSSNSPSYSMQSSRGHRRQPSTGREQRQVNFCPYDGYCFVLDETRCAICMEERGSLPAPMNGSVQPWKKVLYEKQGFEDNYTDRDTFLAELKKNVNVEEYSYPLVMADSFVVTQQITVVVLFVSIFMLTLNGTLTTNTLGILDIATALGGYLVWAVCQSSGSSLAPKPQLLSIDSVLKLFGYGMGLYVLSPVLAALTDPISDDTIAALSIILLVIHLSFQDYGYLNPEPPRARNIETKSPTTPVRVPARTEFVNRMRKGSYGEASFTAAPSPLYHAPVSLNAGIFASLMMASRLSSHNLAFVIIALAVEMFALFPIMAHHLKVRSWWGSFLLVVGLVASAVFLLQRLSNLVTYIYIGTIIFATFVSPFCLQWIQRYKNEIHGPWDEAVPARARRHGTRH